MQKSNQAFIRIKSDGSGEARGTLEVCLFALIKVVNSRLAWGLVALMAAWLGGIKSGELQDLLNWFSSEPRIYEN